MLGDVAPRFASLTSYEERAAPSVFVLIEEYVTQCTSLALVWLFSLGFLNIFFFMAVHLIAQSHTLYLAVAY